MRFVTSGITAIGSPYFNEKNTGLGNVLFQVASVIGIAKVYGLEPVFPRLKLYTDELKTRFQYDHGSTIFRNITTECTFPLESFQSVYETVHKSYSDAIVKQVNESNNHCIVYGHLESAKYFINSQEEIRTLFDMSDAVRESIDKKYGSILHGPHVCIAMHFRGRPDFQAYPVDSSYYRRAMDYICERVPNPFFLVVTDFPECVDVSMFSERNVPYTFINGNVDYMDIYIMSMCKHNIINVSTFGWWGAFLNKNPEKLVLYDKKYSFEYLNVFIGV
jgi:hypothetical protein